MVSACQTFVSSSPIVNELTVIDGRIIRVRRSLAPVLLALISLAPAGCGRSVDVQDCRDSFDAYHDSMSHYDNPGIASLPRLTTRWDSLYRAFERLAGSATESDCSDFDRLTQTVESVELIVVTADDFDMVEQLARVEEDLRQARRDGRFEQLPTGLSAELETLRIAAPLANSDLTAQFGALDRMDPLDGEGVAAAQAALKEAAGASQSFQRSLDSLRSLARYDLGAVPDIRN